MNNVIFLILRRMRAPLLVLIGAYAISIGGLVLIPGVDDAGNPWRFDFFHAFYLITYTASTIGYGEIPYAFTGAQRLWVTLSIYLTVIGWLYAIGTLLALLQDPVFKRALTEQRFARAVRHIKVPFYLICGYGETGALLVRALTRRDVQSVVIDSDPERLNHIALEDFSFDIPHLCADARQSRHLLEGGLRHPRCIGVVAITNDDETNVKIAIVTKVLNPGLKVICRATTQDVAANLKSFNTDHVINPFNIFAVHLAITLRAPSVHLLHDWLISVPNHPLHPPVKPPRGPYILMGYGRFGKAVKKHLEYEGVPTRIIEPHAEECAQETGAIIGPGTEAVTQREAGIDKAVAIVAGTDSDANNLSIIMTARDLNPDLYLIARQNRRSNDDIFQAAGLDMIMQGSRIIVWRILPLLTAPLLSRFLHLARHHHEEWAGEVVDRVRAVCRGVTPRTWAVEIGPEQAPAVHAALEAGLDVRLWHLLREPHDRDQTLLCVPLIRVCGKEEILLPEPAGQLQSGDRLLFCAHSDVAGRMAWTLVNKNVLEYIVTGEERPDGYIWRWLARRRARAAPSQST
ncbi:MAG: NAD-binding protein [Pseudomonadota bacterium]|nr:NAD-binding protein [Pseudomonadota bacterium]